MATNRVLCKCGKTFTANQYISHIAAYKQLHKNWTLEMIQSKHRMVELLDIIQASRQFLESEKAQAGQGVKAPPPPKSKGKTRKTKKKKRK
jgi:hypothetical protein